ncbi:MAG: DNA translocase FtsK [bacterium]|nr:DNA translocase FtsK [bacterium]
MPKAKRKKAKIIARSRPKEWVKPETKKSILAILLLALAVVLMLARFNQAGPAGDFIYSALATLLGWGYYLVPFIFILIAILFLAYHQKKFVSMTFFGATIFIIAGLGIIDITLPERGGLLGNVFGSLEAPFGYTASIIIAGSILIASLLLTLNASIKFNKRVAIADVDEEIDEYPDVEVIEPKTPSTAVEDGGDKDVADKADEEAAEESAFIAPVKKLFKSNRAVKYQAQNYIAPPLSLLKSSVEKPTSGDLRANANIIKRTLESFGIPVEMSEINVGPKVTRYTLKPAEGVKIARITALNSDLALALAAHPIRIEAPIPGKSLVGIEVPNKSAAIVRLGSLLGYSEFTNSGSLASIMGRDVTGDPIVVDIEKMPHLLVAGATGSGKSVAIHALLVSLLYKNSPETLRMILIDPKRVELSIYGGIPHLISPVITEGKKAVGALRWAIQEMDRRYEILLGAGSRDIQSYNKSNNPPLPYLLLVIDELADLMAAYGREIENSIVRLAQMARATGIHLLVSTQRPSVEVITGLIKANITARVALQVASQVDSRTILDTAGAEKLLGGGDMLFISSDFSKPKRIQGAYISEEEIQKVANFIKEKNQSLVESEEGEEVDFNQQPNFEELSGDNSDDELFEESVKIVQEAGKASASFLQRRLKIGYARAARLLDIMENKGIIGPGDGAKPREVYGSGNKNDEFEQGFGSDV